MPVRNRHVQWIPDDQYVFRVRSSRLDAGWQQDRILSYHFTDGKRPNRGQTVSPIRCNWNNFLKKRTPYAIQTPYALCNLTRYEQDEEKRAPFINYGGSFTNRKIGDKRTFNAQAVHQLKHAEINEQRTKEILHERRLRHEAAYLFRPRTSAN